MYSASGALEAVPPFDFRKSVDFIGGFPPMQGEQRQQREEARPSLVPTLTKAMMFKGQTIAFKLRGKSDDKVEYELLSETPIIPKQLRT